MVNGHSRPEEPREDSLSLQEVEPSPVDDDPIDVEKDGYFPPDSTKPPPPLARSSTLGLGGHSAVYYLNHIHKYSSYTFSIFLAFHVTNTSIIPIVTRSLSTSDTYLLLTRPYYQSPLAEPLIIILPLLAHITSGIALRLYRRRQLAEWYGADTKAERRRLPWPKLSGTSALGYALIPLVAGHAFVNRIIPLWVEGGSSSIGLQYVAHGFAKHPAVAFAGYAVLVGTAAWHVVWGWAKWLGVNPSQVVEGGPEGVLRRKRRWYGVNVVSVVVAGVWMAGGLGVVGRGGEVTGWLGREYDELYRRVPIVGRWI
ncbi:MAG: hypothetical protein M1827_005916 [Pycnora praestabilis]|nr:MAG: hypothetical protein M1827_005916 [Pycnora praestabilis]